MQKVKIQVSRPFTVDGDGSYGVVVCQDEATFLIKSESLKKAIDFYESEEYRIKLIAETCKDCPFFYNDGCSKTGEYMCAFATMYFSWKVV